MFGIASDHVWNSFHFGTSDQMHSGHLTWLGRTVTEQEPSGQGTTVGRSKIVSTKGDESAFDQQLMNALAIGDVHECISLLKSVVEPEKIERETVGCLISKIEYFSGADLDFVLLFLTSNPAVGVDLLCSLVCALEQEERWKQLVERMLLEGHFAPLLNSFTCTIFATRNNWFKLRYMLGCCDGPKTVRQENNLFFTYAQQMLVNDFRNTQDLEDLGVDVLAELNCLVGDGVPFFFFLGIFNYARLVDYGVDMTLQDRRGNNFFTFSRADIFCTAESKADMSSLNREMLAHKNHLGEDISDRVIETLHLYAGENGAVCDKDLSMSRELLAMVPDNGVAQKKLETFSAERLAALSPDNPPNWLCFVEIEEENHYGFEALYNYAPCHTSAYRFHIGQPAIEKLKGGQRLPVNTLLVISCHANSVLLSGHTPRFLSARLAELLRSECESVLPSRVILHACCAATPAWKQFGVPLPDGSAQVSFALQWQSECQDDVEVVAFDGLVSTFAQNDSRTILKPRLITDWRVTITPVRLFNRLVGIEEQCSAITLFVDRNGKTRTVRRVLPNAGAIQ